MCELLNRPRHSCLVLCLYQGSVTEVCYSLLNVLYRCALMPQDVLICHFGFETTFCFELWTYIAVFCILCDDTAKSRNVGRIQVSCRLLTKMQFLQEWKRRTYFWTSFRSDWNSQVLSPSGSEVNIAFSELPASSCRRHTDIIFQRWIERLISCH
jgi:hypothetical protein